MHRLTMILVLLKKIFILYIPIPICRGFLFFDDFPFFYIWNPSTGVDREIPCCPRESMFDIFMYLFGFGYDPLTDDYLVVFGSCDPNSTDCLTHLEFFSVRANTWKEIEGTHLPYRNASDNPRVGSLLNTAIHWLVFRHDISVNVILAFDLMERSLSEIPLPDGFDHDPTYCDLWVFRGFLSLWVLDSDIVEIWVMKEYKVQSSWTNTIVLSIHDISTQYFAPICSTKSGDIVGTDGNMELVKYNDKEQLLERRSYGDHPPGSQVIMFIESLLSLPGSRRWRM